MKVNLVKENALKCMETFEKADIRKTGAYEILANEETAIRLGVRDREYQPGFEGAIGIIISKRNEGLKISQHSFNEGWNESSVPVFEYLETAERLFSEIEKFADLTAGQIISLAVCEDDGFELDNPEEFASGCDPETLIFDFHKLEDGYLIEVV